MAYLRLDKRISFPVGQLVQQIFKGIEVFISRLVLSFAVGECEL